MAARKHSGLTTPGGWRKRERVGVRLNGARAGDGVCGCDVTGRRRRWNGVAGGGAWRGWMMLRTGLRGGCERASAGRASSGGRR